MSLRNPLLTRLASKPVTPNLPASIFRPQRQYALPSTRAFSLQRSSSSSPSSSSFSHFFTPRNPTTTTTKTTPAPRITPWTTARTQQAQFKRFFNSTRAGNSSSSTQQNPHQAPSLSQRLKTLSREYGWSALWIYLFLSALDFPFCFAAVRFLGADTIGHYEHVVVESVKEAVGTVWPGLWASPRDEEKEGEEGEAKQVVKLAEEEGDMKKDGGAGASLWTQLALAYAIHKSFIFIRVPLTAAITPKVVKVLRQWGWDVVKGKPKGM